ncbi:MAG TPA: hypothetical protein VJ860_17210 [Polyangia bacterium]|nr:hypothetical protein [Polyangia bacterium]
MKTQSKIACVFVLLCLAGCKKGEVAKPAAAPAPSVLGAARPTMPMSRPAMPAMSPGDVAEAKALLTDDKLSRFAVYQKEMLSVTSDTMGVGMRAFAKGGTDQKKFQGAMAADDRTAKIADASKSALEKSGLTQDEMAKLMRVAPRYYAHVYALQQAAGKVEGLRKKIDEAKASGKQPSVVDVAMEKAYSGQAAQLELVRKEFAMQYGPEALTLMQKHEPEFFTINEKMMGAAMGAMMKKP